MKHARKKLLKSLQSGKEVIISRGQGEYKETVKITASKGTPIPQKDIAETNARIKKNMKNVLSAYGHSLKYLKEAKLHDDKIAKHIYFPSQKELDKVIEAVFVWLSKEPCQIASECYSGNKRQKHEGFFAYYRKDLTSKEMVKRYLNSLK